MTAREGALTAVAAINRSTPAALFQSEGKLPEIGVFRKGLPLRLEAEDLAQIQLKTSELWSTSGLSARMWMFYPSVAAGANGVAIATNTADGHAIGWIVAGSEVRRTVFLAGALNPTVLNVAAGNRIFYRKMPADWSVYFHNTRYSGQYGPIPLPLMMAALDAHEDPKTVDGLGAVFDFAAASPDGKRIAIAAIVGSRSAPELRLFELRDLNSPLVLRRIVPIRAIPYRVAIAATNDNVLAGLAFKNNAGFDLEGFNASLE